jgi:hypothetical protein
MRPYRRFGGRGCGLGLVTDRRFGGESAPGLGVHRLLGIHGRNAFEKVVVEKLHRFFGQSAFLFGGEFLGDVGTFGPFPELLFALVVSVGLLEGEALARNAKAFGVVVAAAKAGDVGAKLAEAGPFEFGVGLGGDQGLGGGGVLNGNPAGEFRVELVSKGLVTESLFVFEVGDHSEGVLADLPVEVAALLPFGEVGGQDGPTAEAGGEDGLNFRQGVEPGEDGFAAFTVVEAAVELFADGVGE